MTRKPDEIRNVDASVRQRLFNLSKEQSRDFQSILKLYFLERFLYRLSVSRYRDSFLLKGALLFFARAEPEARPFTRPTKDVDLEALAMEPDLDGLREIFAVIAAIAAPEDGVRFDPESITVESIREDDRHGGIRVHLDAYLGKARDRIQIDVGFGDAVTPAPVALTYPTFLPALPAPALSAYPIESVVAEKWEATISLGDANSRLKDAIDLDELAGSESFDGAILQRAIRRTFERRGTPTAGLRVVMDSNLRVAEVLKGSASGLLSIREYGGKAGSLIEVAEDAVALTPGQRLLVFLVRSPIDGHYWILGGFQGRHFIEGVRATNERGSMLIDEWRVLARGATR